ncbi:hypothetical protein [Myxococcus xanthus]|uniref:hypothetical protein n=1 Tax=Myxococcus xanthus TaxID=34 RepID=UPI001F393629|nr:hypothetical protein [Myxococcus xanthus]
MASTAPRALAPMTHPAASDRQNVSLLENANPGVRFAFGAAHGGTLFLTHMFDPPTSARALSDSTREEEPELLSTSGELPTPREARVRFERRDLCEALRRSKGNVAAAACMASHNLTDFYELLRRHGLPPNLE